MKENNSGGKLASPLIKEGRDSHMFESQLPPPLRAPECRMLIEQAGIIVMNFFNFFLIANCSVNLKMRFSINA